MAEKRFPGADEIATLRNRGVVSGSPLVCRLCSGILVMFFLYYSQIPEQFKEMLSVSETTHGANLPVASLIDPLKTLVTAAGLYLFSFILFALFQSRFYFSPGRVFKQRAALAVSRPGINIMRISVLFSTLCIISLTTIILVFWKEAFFSQIALAGQGGLAYAQEVLVASASKLVFVLVFVLMAIIAVLVLFAKLNFLFRHRVSPNSGSRG